MKQLHKYDIENIIEEIIEKFGTQRELAKQLGIAEGNLSTMLKNPSKKFIKRLESLGITVTKNKNIQHNGNTGLDNRMLYELIKDIGEIKARLDAIEKNYRKKL